MTLFIFVIQTKKQLIRHTHPPTHSVLVFLSFFRIIVYTLNKKTYRFREKKSLLKENFFKKKFTEHHQV